MSKDHFIPACLIGRFSDEETGAARERKVWTLYRGGHRAERRAENIGFQNGIYDIDDHAFPTHGAKVIDDLWKSYENDLPRALDRLIDRSVTASEWINTLVPFVAAAFARDRGYKDRVSERLSKSTEEEGYSATPELAKHILGSVNLGFNRVREMGRYAARALACEWVVQEVDADIVLPDLGYGFVVNRHPDVVGLVLPIGQRHLLTLIPCPSRRILSLKNGTWTPSISYLRSPYPGRLWNELLVETAQDFVVGTQTAIDHVETGDLGNLTRATIDSYLAHWPFNVDTRLLNGLDGVVRGLIDGEFDSFEGVVLDPHQAIKEREPQALFFALDPKIRADQFLKIDDHGLTLTVHFPAR